MRIYKFINTELAGVISILVMLPGNDDLYVHRC